MKNLENDFEQLYYDSQYEIKRLKGKISELEIQLSLINKNQKKKIDLRKQILEDFRNYKERSKDGERNNSQ